jgi:sn-glycerol 3-phosphate transport system permease protein
VLEAARLDGATGLRLQRSIVLPLITPQLFFLVVTGTIHSLQSFGQIRILTRGGPEGNTTTLVYSIFEQAFDYNNSNFGYASAQALVLLLVVLVITAVQFGILERKVFYR